MKTKRNWIVCGAVILLLLFAAVMHREVAGSVTIFTVRGTDLRIYQSDSGNLAFASRTDSERLREPQWFVTRRSKAAWWVVGIGTLYIEFPFLVADLLNPRN
jgi:hypothetical protein